MRTIAIVNQKGGCGKTTTAINLGASLGRLGRRTLLVDLDPQGHCAAGLGVPDVDSSLDTSDLLLRAPERHAGQELWRASTNLDLIPSRVRLAGVESPSSPLAKHAGRERRLSEALKPFAARFDVCLLDCPPTIGLLTYNALTAADLVLVPVETAYFSLQGATRQLKTVRALSQRLDTSIRCVVLPTLHEPGVSVADDLLAELKRQFGRRVLPVVIQRDVALREAASFGKPVCQHAPTSQASKDYAALASVLVETEDLDASAVAADWSDVDEASVEPPARPIDPNAQPAPRRQASAEEACFSGLGGSTISTSAEFSTALRAPAPGEIVVTLGNGDLSPKAGPNATTPPGTRSETQPSVRAQEMVQRTSRAVQAQRLDLGVRKPVFGHRVTPGGVEFIQPGAGKHVAVVGSFSDWRPIELHHDPRTNTHAGKLAIPAGQHEYRLLVDGRSTPDPYNTEWTPGENGEAHSLLEVPAERPADADPELRCGAD